ncbi:MAG: 16S rRNA (uracil(1498)-N(3))-methyltransferase [Synechococcaceae cyanobacterium SM2_3_1]|nr:16S rRNA (uracil(1498)-N(3))-methyltransferase [Synechococcaceae cyanobacterium SM2_3_1]
METSRLVLPECADRLSQLPRILIPSDHTLGDWIALPQDQLHYLCHVRRLTSRDPLLVVDGGGQLWLARLIQTQVQLEKLLPSPTQELPLPIHVGMAVLKGNAMDDLIRQFTELGVQRITPLLTERTLVQPSPAKQQRWQRIAQEAVEQCERLQVPVITPPIPWGKWLQDLGESSFLMAVARTSAPSVWQILKENPPTQTITLAIGPEGGWSETEIEQAIAFQGELVSLGSRILRAVTAAPVFTALVAAWIEDHIEPIQARSPTTSEQ